MVDTVDGWTWRYDLLAGRSDDARFTAQIRKEKAAAESEQSQQDVRADLGTCASGPTKKRAAAESEQRGKHRRICSRPIANA